MAKLTIERAIATGREMGHVFVATAGSKGMPHLTVAGQVAATFGGETIVVTEWFCPDTVANLRENENVSVVAWNPGTDEGYQMIGRVEETKEQAVIDGYSPDTEPASVPQIERKLVIRVARVLDFSQAPHTDEPE
jgi:hypothetical protein